jgi:hypothetical protein
MNKEIPYAIYVKNETKELTGSIELTELTELPVSIEIVPHKAILVQDAIIVGRGNRNYIHINSKGCFFICCIIPFMFAILLVVGILEPDLFTTK